MKYRSDYTIFGEFISKLERIDKHPRHMNYISTLNENNKIKL